MYLDLSFKSIVDAMPAHNQDYVPLLVYRHFFLHCPTFARLRLKHLDSLTFGEPLVIAETDISRLNKFVIGSVDL